MFDFTELKNNNINENEGSFKFFDKEAYQKYIQKKDYEKNKFFEFGPKGEIYFGTNKLELLETHNDSGRVFAVDNEINHLVISTTNIKYPLKIPTKKIMPHQLDQIRNLGFFKSEMVTGKDFGGLNTVEQIDTVSDNIDLNKFLDFADSTKNHKYDPPILIPERYAIKHNLKSRFVDKKFLENYGLKNYLNYLLSNEEPVYSSLNPKILNKIFKLENFKLFKRIIGKINVESGEIIIVRETGPTLTVKGDKGIYEIYEIFDESYKSNIEEEQSIMNYEKENNKLIDTDKYNENHWVARKDFSPSEPNIHLLFLSLIDD